MDRESQYDLFRKSDIKTRIRLLKQELQRGPTTTFNWITDQSSVLRRESMVDIIRSSLQREYGKLYTAKLDKIKHQIKRLNRTGMRIPLDLCTCPFLKRNLHKTILECIEYTVCRCKRMGTHHGYDARKCCACVTNGQISCATCIGKDASDNHSDREMTAIWIEQDNDLDPQDDAPQPI